MKVCIVTVYDNINSGSFWQAYALGQAIKMLGHEVYYYKRNKKGASPSIAIQLKKIIKLTSHLHFLEAYDYLRQIISFRITPQKYTIIDKSSKIYGLIDCFILGSDTIWNLNSEYYKNNKSIFWGDIFNGRRLVSYAGSIANTKQETIINDEEYSNSIKRWSVISVRDEYTKNVLTRITDRQVHLVCDPTLLFKKDFYSNICPQQTGNYIFLYLFKKLNHNQDLQLRAFAVKNKLKIICGTERNISSQTNRFIINCPYNFMAYMLGAKYVITDTYHGTIFSTNFNKQFVVINRNLIKVRDFLSLIGLANRIIDRESDINIAMNQTINYDYANQKLQELRCCSLNFLKYNIH